MYFDMARLRVYVCSTHFVVKRITYTKIIKLKKNQEYVKKFTIKTIILPIIIWSLKSMMR